MFNTEFVKVMANEVGATINICESNSKYGYIKVYQERLFINDNGFLEKKKLTSVIIGLLENLKELQPYDGMEIPGKIIIQESLEPFNKKNPERNLKIAGDTGVVCKYNNLPIYRRTVATFDLSKSDILISHDNKHEILKAQKQNTVAALKDLNLEEEAKLYEVHAAELLEKEFNLDAEPEDNYE